MINLKCILPHGGFRDDGLKYYDGVFKDKHCVNKGDIVIANTDLTQARDILGCPAFVPNLKSEKTLISHHLYAVRQLETSPLKTNFIYHVLLSPSVRDRCRGFATGTTVLAINQDVIKDAEFVIPSIEQLNLFEQTAAGLQEQISVNTQQSQTLAELRDTLLPKLISGELRIPEAEEQVTDALS